ncbi:MULTISPECIES: GspE/PulE family protein [Thiorhodovibrio]|uniref:GspE/PulE family protein n=1 Tax=Thiorhodovibrio TaxID=61593 RepID=UPI001F5C14CC|nr:MULTISPECIES: GspE/PulE family protein [Thiorhodovibrio]MBK5967342.1 type II secretion system protein E [Thiorhodovibrio winogradskyi]WPL14870.1 Type II traffic warden ATPase [Thiorhodovibrio litoralis]
MEKRDPASPTFRRRVTDCAIPTEEAQGNRVLTLKEVLTDLTADGLVSRETADTLLQRAARQKPAEKHVLEIIADAELTSARPPHQALGLEDLTVWLAERCGLPYLRIDPLKIDVGSIGELTTAAYAKWNRILPVALTAQKAVFATCEPHLSDWVGELENILKLKIERVVSNPRDIDRYRREFFDVSRSMRGARSTHAETNLSLHNLEALVDLGKTGALDASDSHIVHLVDWLLQYAFEQRASDIHLEPRRDAGNIRFRIDGVMHAVSQIPPVVMAAVTSRIKILGRMDVAEKRRPQDGRIKTRTEAGLEAEMRLSTMPTAFGEKLVIRIFNPEALQQDLSQLGFEPEEAAAWKDMTALAHGIILVTGPTGSGKTTTLYSTLTTLATPDVNVCTVEDPIENLHPNLNQMQVNHSIGLDFASGVRTLLRQDPDVIMVGEIRDLETAEMAIQAALTGHLVLSTLHTNDAPSAITRLLDLGVPYYMINATLIGVLAQRLVRTFCPHCKAPATPDATLWKSLVKPWDVAPPTRVAMPVGCLECRNTGYFGRAGLYELLRLTPSVRDCITREVDEPRLRTQALKEGMRPLRIGGARKIAAGVTSFEEVFRAAPMPSD